METISKPMNKKRRKIAELTRHYQALQRLYDLCGGGKSNGRAISSRLLSLEHTATRFTTMLCNGEGDESNNEQQLTAIEKRVNAIFNNNLKGFLINRDPRGYALKIDDAILKANYSECNLHRDMGGYGILAPEITGS
jgi:hypothetical protein